MEEYENVRGLTIPVDLPPVPVQWRLPKTPKIPRPPNAFMIFANDWRRKIAHDFPELSNKEVSVKLGVMWKALHKNGKDYYFSLARAADMRHKLMYPDYVYNPKEARIRKFLREQCRKSQPKSQSKRKRALCRHPRKSRAAPRSSDASDLDDSLLETYLPVISTHDDLLELSELRTGQEDIENYILNNGYMSETSVSDVVEKDFSEFMQGLMDEDGPRVIVAPAFSDPISDFRREDSFPNLEVEGNEEIVIADLDGPNWFPFNMSAHLASTEGQSNAQAVASILDLSAYTPIRDESANSNAASSSSGEETGIYSVVTPFDLNEFMSVNDNLDIGYVLNHDDTEAAMKQKSTKLDNEINSLDEHNIPTMYGSSCLSPETVNSNSVVQGLHPLYTLKTINSVKDHDTYLPAWERRQYNGAVSAISKMHEMNNHTSSAFPRSVNCRNEKPIESASQDVKCDISLDLPYATSYSVTSFEDNSFCVNDSTAVASNPLISHCKTERMELDFRANSQSCITSPNFDIKNFSPFGVPNCAESFDSPHENSSTQSPVDFEGTEQQVKNTECVDGNKYQFHYLTKLDPTTKDVDITRVNNNECNTVTTASPPKNHLSSKFDHRSFLATLKSSVNVSFSKGQPLILRRRGTGNKGENVSQKKMMTRPYGKFTRGQTSSNIHYLQNFGKDSASIKMSVGPKTAGQKITSVINKIVNGDLRYKDVSVQP